MPSNLHTSHRLFLSDCGAYSTAVVDSRDSTGLLSNQPRTVEMGVMLTSAVAAFHS